MAVGSLHELEPTAQGEVGLVWGGPLPLPLPLLTVAPRAMARFRAVARRCGWSMLTSAASAAQYALSPPRFEAQRT